MKGKIILITGATTGIGKATAEALAGMGAHVILHGRNKDKLLALQKALQPASCDILCADLSLLSDVRKMATVFYEKYTHLDVLINNAGVMMGREREITAEGFEKTMATNLLAPYLLTVLLLDALKASTGARIVNVSSSAHRQNAHPDFNDLQSEQHYSPLRMYGNTKLYLILLSRYFAQHLAGITVNTLHPGAVASNFSVNSDLGWLLQLAGKLARRFFKTPREGADTEIWLATSPEVAGITGQYFIHRKPAPVHKKYDTVENAQRVLTFCEQATRQHFR